MNINGGIPNVSIWINSSKLAYPVINWNNVPNLF